MDAAERHDDPVGNTQAVSEDGADVKETKPTDQSDSGNITNTSEAGVAKVKTEYLDLEHKPRLVTEYMPAEAAEELRDITSKFDHDKATSGQQDSEMTADEPPNKKVKLKGRNKKRPRVKRADASTRLCPKLVEGTTCQFGEKCIYSHDFAGFLSAKPEDLGKKCHMFQTFGKCPYGVTCRFGSSHLDKDANNIVDEERYAQSQKQLATCNTIGKDLQATLRKKKYNFARADKIVKIMEKMRKQNISTDKSCEKASSETKSISSGDREQISLPKCEHEKLCLGGDSQVLVTASSETAGNNSTLDKGDVTGQNQAISSGESTDTAVCKDPVSECGKETSHSAGCVTDEDLIRLRISEKKKINFADKLYLAPLTTVGNLPFRRICKEFGADITCGEMAMVTNLLQGQQSEWALLRRHHTEDLFGVQICGGWVDSLTRGAQMLCENISVDFIDLNCGCPIDLLFKRGEGSALMGRANRFEHIVQAMSSVMDVPLTVKFRTGIFEDKQIAHTLLPRLRRAGASLVTLHGRSREQRYTRLADWDYIKVCAEAATPMPLFGNGDILSYEDYNLRRSQTGVAGCMIARGALIKPWIFTEIKEQRHWDISANERLDILRKFVNNGLEHWGSDQQGVDTTRRFLLEWLSFLYRYIPVGVLERVPQRINERPPHYFGRNDLETLMASGNCGDWVKISEMLLGPVPPGFSFLPKHKANSYK